jgi:hypothetical protein
MEDPSFKAPPDLIQLVIDGTKGGEGRDLDYQVNAQIGTGRAALFTTGVTVFHLLYDLATRSEYIEPLRQEVVALGDVAMNRANVAKLTKMDSFIRECQRFSKFMLGTCSSALVFYSITSLGFSFFFFSFFPLVARLINLLQWELSARSLPPSSSPTERCYRLVLSLVLILTLQSSAIRRSKTPRYLMALGTYFKALYSKVFTLTRQ